MTADPFVMNRLGLDQWHYETWFMPRPSSTLHAVFDEIEEYIESRRLQEHPFFERARSSERALRLWATQELVMTNAFSQIVLIASAGVVNVHLRTMLGHVAFGEHGPIRHGVARRAHPWLLNQLRESMGISPSEVSPAPTTRSLIERLAESVAHPLTAAAWIGIGNERLIIPEYTAIKACFQACLPTVKYEKFLDANLHEDVGHSRLCYEFASAILNDGGSVELFRGAAIASVDSRIRYFDELLASLD